MTRTPLLFLEDILNAIERIESYTILGKDEFFNNPTVQDAIALTNFDNLSIYRIFELRYPK